MRKSWRRKLRAKPSFPEVLRPEKGLPCHDPAREIRLARWLSINTGTLLCPYRQ